MLTDSETVKFFGKDLECNLHSTGTVVAAGHYLTASCIITSSHLLQALCEADGFLFLICLSETERFNKCILQSECSLPVCAD